jgi:predicted nucleic acid-binding protein
MVLFDSAFLLLVLDPKAQTPRDPKSDKVIEKGRARVEHLIDVLSDTRTRMLVPAPVLAEVLVHAGAATAEYIVKIRGVSSMQVADFDTLAAIECAQLTGAALKKGKKRGAAGNEPWQKVKIDRQIVAIAKVHRAEVIYTCDAGLASAALAEGFEVKHIADLPMPPLKDQSEMFQD